MQSLKVVFTACVLLALCSACSSQQPQAQQPQAEYRTTATVKDIMDSMVDPGADNIWDSVETVVSAKGVEEKAPHTDEEWKEVRRHAIMLMEATNLLQIPGRHVAKPGEKAEDPKVELAPEQIEDMINKDRAAWIKYAHALHDATMEAFKAIEEKDAAKLLDVGNGIDEACEKCHLQYWYPNERKPESAPSQRSGTSSSSKWGD
jgi:cytochrome c556